LVLYTTCYDGRPVVHAEIVRDDKI
jgi:hypothetical protein